jgi:TolB protein
MRAMGLLCVAVIASGCELAGGGGGVGGGGGSGGGGAMMTSFTKGYVYVRKDDGNIYIVDESDLQATARLTTTGSARNPSISKDGKRVVFSRQLGAETEIATVGSTGGANTSVLSSSATVKNLRNPVFSKDGTKIYFAYDLGTASALGVVNTDGTEFKSLVGSSTFSYASPSLFADGLSLLAGAGNSGTNLTQLEKVDAASGMATNVTNTLGTSFEGTVIANRVVISPDGLRAAYDGRLMSGSSRIFVVNLTSKTVTQLTDYPGDPTANDTFPTWVGNDKIAFSSDTGGNDQIYVLPATGMKTSGGFTLGSALEPWYGP